jgi:hypothetical protein
MYNTSDTGSVSIIRSAFYSGGGTILTQLGTSTISGSIVPVPDDR